MNKHVSMCMGIIVTLVTAVACDRDSLSERLTQPGETAAELRSEDYKFVADTMPEIIGGIEVIHKNITYPESAKDDGIGGTVYLFAYIDTEGNVAHVEVAKGVRDDLDLAAIEAVKPVKFKPAMNDGVPVGIRVSIPIHFRLK
jgi:TonB family protein